MSKIRLTVLQTAENFQILDLFIGGNGIAEYAELSELQIPAEIDWRKGVIINGRAPIWLYAFCVHQCHPAAWVAVMDPRHGGIVIESHDVAGPTIGATIPLEILQEYLPKHEKAERRPNSPTAVQCKRVAFVGPPHSGKSVLMRTIHNALRTTLPAEQFQRQVFLFRACPDGEGNWFGEVPIDRALTLRHKAPWNQEFAEQICAHLEGLAKSKKLVLVDFGGKIDRYTQQILNRCSHAVIVSHHPSAISEWRGALQASDIEVIAEIHSSLDEVSEISCRLPLRVHLGPLERGKENIRIPEELIDSIRVP